MSSSASDEKEESSTRVMRCNVRMWRKVGDALHALHCTALVLFEVYNLVLAAGLFAR